MEERRQLIEETVKLIAGYEEAIRMSLHEGDKEVTSTLEECKSSAYKRLRSIVYGTYKQAGDQPET